MDMVLQVEEIAARYEDLDALVPIHSIRSKRDCERAIKTLNQLLDMGGAQSGNRLAPLVDTLGTLIQAYEDAEVRIPPVSGAAALRFLMDQHGVRQSDLAQEIGSQSVVSEILSGKRELTARHIRALCSRFSVSADVFI